MARFINVEIYNSEYERFETWEYIQDPDDNDFYFYYDETGFDYTLLRATTEFLNNIQDKKELIAFILQE